MAWADIVNFLKSIGIVPEAIIPLVILSLIVCIIFLIKFKEVSTIINKALTPIRRSIIEIQGILGTAGFNIRYLLTETTNSPLKPTEFGLKLFNESGLKKIFEDKKEKFLKELDNELKEKTPFTNYDVQEKALKIMVGYQDDELMNPVKSYAYKQGISVEAILRVGGLILRDEYLKPKKSKG